MTPDETTGSAPAPTAELPQELEIPVLGLGTWELTGSTCEEIVEEALILGYRHIDTAEAYGNEERIGRALDAAAVDRDELFITSKVFRDNLRADEVAHACRASLDRLGTDYLDLYLIHWPNPEVPLEETVNALKQLVVDDLVRGWGVCNFTASHLTGLTPLGRPATNQVELHPYLVQDELDRACWKRGIPITAYSPLGRGRLADDEVLGEIGGSHGKTAAQVALRWSIQRGRIVIPKASSRPHLVENLDVFDFELGDDELDRIDGLDRGVRFVDPAWAEFDR